MQAPLKPLNLVLAINKYLKVIFNKKFLVVCLRPTIAQYMCMRNERGDGEVQREEGGRTECGPHEVVVNRVLPKGERPSTL